MKENKKKKEGKSNNIFKSIAAYLAKSVWRTVMFIGAMLVLVFILIAVISSVIPNQKTITSSADLEKVIKVSELTTYKSPYHGIAEVSTQESIDSNKEEHDYYVYYKAEVLAGIDFSKISISKKDENTYIVNIPDAKIQDIKIDIESLEYIFKNESAETSTVIEEAYQACHDDINVEILSDLAIQEYAQKNAKNIIDAMVVPFLEENNNDFKIEYVFGGEVHE